MGLRGAVRRVPVGARPWVVGVVVLLANAMVYAAVAAILVLLLDAQWWEGLPQFVGVSVGVGLVTWWRDRGHTLSDRSRRRALRSGRLPADADLGEWRRSLHQEAQLQVWSGRVLVVAVPVVLVLLAWIASTTDSPGLGWGLFALVVVMSALVWAGRRRNLRRIGVVRDQLPDD